MGIFLVVDPAVISLLTSHTTYARRRLIARSTAICVRQVERHRRRREGQLAVPAHSSVVKEERDRERITPDRLILGAGTTGQLCRNGSGRDILASTDTAYGLWEETAAMQLPDIPTPDDAIKSLLVAVFGSSATIVVVYAVANAIMSWLGVAKTAIKAGKTVRNTGRNLLRLRPVRVASTIAYTVTILVLQAFWLATAFVIGNGISWFFVGRPGMENGPNWQVFTSTLHADTVSNVYTGAGLLLLLIQYAATRRSTWGDWADRLVTWFNAPLFFIGGLCGVGVWPSCGNKCLTQDARSGWRRTGS